MSSPLVTEVSGPFLVLPVTGQSTPITQEKSWAQQQIEKQGSSNTQSWLPSTDIITPVKQSMKLGSMGTMELLPTNTVLPAQSTQNTQVVHPTPANVQQLPTSSTVANTDIQAALQSGKVDVLNDGIYETEASAFGFANTSSPTMSSYVVYGVIVLAALALVWYLYKEEYF